MKLSAEELEKEIRELEEVKKEFYIKAEMRRKKLKRVKKRRKNAENKTRKVRFRQKERRTCAWGQRPRLQPSKKRQSGGALRAGLRGRAHPPLSGH